MAQSLRTPVEVTEIPEEEAVNGDGEVVMEADCPTIDDDSPENDSSRK